MGVNQLGHWDLFTFGETMGLVTACDTGLLSTASQCIVGIGGAESNVAIGARRLGASVAWWGRLGDDAVGQMITDRLNAEGIETSVIRDTSRPTGLMVRTQRFADITRIDYHRKSSAASAMTPAEIPKHLVVQSRVVHLTGITAALSDSAHATVQTVIQLARASGALISFDVNHRSKLWSPERAGPVLRDIAASADIVFAGPDEARMVTGLQPHEGSDIDLALALASLGPEEAIVKAGSRGATAVIDRDILQKPAWPVTVVDTVGAGDAFVAGYLADRLAGQSPAVCLATAIHVSALAVSVRGDCEGLPRRHELALAAIDDDVIR